MNPLLVEGETSKDVLTVAEVAAAWRVSPKAIYLAIRRGEVPTVRIGTSIRLKRSSVEKWLREQNSAEGGAP
jgi:excisionase family DNA binding protein